MNFEDEPYVRLYTRNTPTWMLLGWEGQTVLMHMLRSGFDRAGIFELDGLTPSQAVTAVTGLPPAVVEPAMGRLLERKVWTVQGERLIWPNYLRAQTCARSDRLRQAESRSNRRATALLPITPQPEELSRNVTECHDLSQASQSVTLSLALPSSAEDPPVVPPSEGPTPKTTRKRRQTSGTPAPESLEPNAATLRCAQEMGLDPVREIAACLDFHRGKGSIQVDWQATARTWFRNALKFQGKNQPKPPGLDQLETDRAAEAARKTRLFLAGGGNRT